MLVETEADEYVEANEVESVYLDLEDKKVTIGLKSGARFSTPMSVAEAVERINFGKHH